MARAGRGGGRLSVEMFLAHRHAVLAEERALVSALNDALKGLGYEVVATTARRPTGRRARPRRAATSARARKEE